MKDTVTIDRRVLEVLAGVSTGTITKYDVAIMLAKEALNAQYERLAILTTET